MCPLELRFCTTKSICLALFFLLWCVSDAQCCEVNIHFAMTSGEQPLPMKNNKSLKVSLSPVGFFPEKLLYVGGPGLDGIKDVSVK